MQHAALQGVLQGLQNRMLPQLRILRALAGSVTQAINLVFLEKGKNNSSPSRSKPASMFLPGGSNSSKSPCLGRDAINFIVNIHFHCNFLKHVYASNPGAEQDGGGGSHCCCISTGQGGESRVQPSFKIISRSLFFFFFPPPFPSQLRGFCSFVHFKRHWYTEENMGPTECIEHLHPVYHVLLCARTSILGEK